MVKIKVTVNISESILNRVPEILNKEKEKMFPRFKNKGELFEFSLKKLI